MNAPHSEPAESDLHLETRMASARSWAAAAEWVVRKTGDEYAGQTLALLKDRGALGVPMPGNRLATFHSQPPTGEYSDYVYLTPLLRNDQERLPVDDGRRDIIAGRGVAARYAEGSQAIYVSPARYPKMVRGILLLHELDHAYIDIVDSPDRSTPDSHWLEEAEVFIREFRLLSTLGGFAYTHLVEESANAIRRDSANPGRIYLNFERLAPKRTRYFARTGIRGRASFDLLSSVVELQAFWTFAQANYQDPKRDLAMFLKFKYKSVNQTP